MHEYWSSDQYDAICDQLEKDIEEETHAEQGVIDNLLRVGVQDQDMTEQVHDDSGGEDDFDIDSGDNSEDRDTDEGDEHADLNNHGLRYRCPLNQLKSFHSTLSFPPDCMHDVLEGVVAQDLYGGIKILSIRGFFSIDEYNRKLKGLGYTSYEASDVPEAVPKKAKKLSGKACSLWVHIRNFPLVVKDFLLNNDDVDSDDEVLIWVLKLVDIVNRITATDFRSHEIENMESKIVEYLDARKEIYDQYPDVLGTPKPKHHLLGHYGQAVRLYGPPLAYWTGRFERLNLI